MRKSKWIICVSLLAILLPVVACNQEAPDVEWELTIDGDVDQPVTYTFRDLVNLRRARLTDVPTRDPANPDEFTAWEGVTLFLLFKQPAGVEYSVSWWALFALSDGSSRRFNMSELRGALIAFKDGDGNWLYESGPAPIRLIAPNRPSDEWLYGPVRITVQAPQS
jgi:DMSO/TMAO reductase YedYZ molybdopterin-dependent catalytic subunit